MKNVVNEAVKDAHNQGLAQSHSRLPNHQVLTGYLHNRLCAFVLKQKQLD